MKQPEKHQIRRRQFLSLLGAGATLAIPGWVLGQEGILLPVTPRQTEGPFYPETTIEKQMFSDTDLTRKLGDDAISLGQPANINGVVMNRKGEPLKDSIVEVWQACASGKYNHSGDDANDAKLDENFQFWGRAVTGADGAFSFTTIIPGMYPGRDARHIHFRVDSPGYRRLTTQCYFSNFGDDNMRDGIYRDLSRSERKLVTLEFEETVAKPWDSSSFHMVMRRA